MNFVTKIFTSRKVWIALAAVGGTIVTLLNADPEKWTPLITTIVALAGVVIAAIGYEDGAEKAAGTFIGPDSLGTNAATGANAAPYKVPPQSLNALLPFVLMLGLLAGGCSSPRAQWAVARESLTQTERTLVAANQSGLLDDQDFVATEPFVKAARGGLARADAELIASNEQPTSRFRFYLKLVQSTLADLAKYPQAKDPQAKPVTQ